MQFGLRPNIILLGSGELRFQRLEDEQLLLGLLNSWDGDLTEVGTDLGLDESVESCNCNWSRTRSIENFTWIHTTNQGGNEKQTLIPQRRLQVVKCVVCASSSVGIRRVTWICWVPAVDACLLIDCVLTKQVLNAVHFYHFSSQILSYSQCFGLFNFFCLFLICHILEIVHKRIFLYNLFEL